MNTQFARKLIYLFSILTLVVQPGWVISNIHSVHAAGLSMQSPADGSMPGYQDPPYPIPYNRPGYPSKISAETRAQLASAYQPWAEGFNRLSAEQAGSALDFNEVIDPLAGNYTMVNYDQMALVTSWGNTWNGGQHFRTYSAGTLQDDGSYTYSSTPNAVRDVYTEGTGYGNTRSGDINNDGVDEIVTAINGKLQVGNLSDKRFGQGAPAVVSPYPGVTWLFVRGYDDQLWVQRGLGKGWVALGGTLASSPTAVSPSAGQVIVLVLATNTNIYRCEVGDVTSNCEWINLGAAPEGKFTGEPAMTANGSGIEDYFVRSSDNRLWHRTWNEPQKIWSGDWVTLSGYILSSPSVTRRDSRTDLVASGYDNALWHMWRASDHASWSAWESLGGMVQKNPVIVSPAASTFDVFATRDDNQVWRKSYRNGEWSQWAKFPDSSTHDGPAAAVVRDSQRVVMATRGTAGPLTTAYRDEPTSSWSALTADAESTRQLGMWSKRFSNISFSKIELGHFIPNGRMQLINARLDNKKLFLDFYAFSGGFTPEPIKEGIEVTLNHQILNLNDTYLEAGDYDGDGADELALLAYSDEYCNLYLIKLDGIGNIIAYGAIQIGNYGDWGVKLSHGNYNGDVETIADDEIAVGICSSGVDRCDAHIYNPHKNGNTFDLGNPVINPLTQNGINVRYHQSFSIASGDFVPDPKGFTKDELAFTGIISFSYYTIILGWRYDTVLDTGIFQMVGGVKIEWVDNAWDWKNLEERGLGSPRSYNARNTTADLDRDGQAEVVSFFEIKNDDKYNLDYKKGFYYFKHNQLAAELQTKGSKIIDEDRNTSETRAEFLAGNFSGQGIRVEKPAYRLVKNVGNLVARVNTPPQIVVGGVVQNPESYAWIEMKNSTTQYIKVEAKSHWNVEANASYTLGDKNKNYLEFSLNGSYGQDFSKVKGSSKSIEYKYTITTNGVSDDMLLYALTDYQLFEYPINNGLSNDLAYMTVTWPNPQSTTVLKVTTPNSCDMLRNPNHDVKNPLSYPALSTDLPEFNNGNLGPTPVITSQLTADFSVDITGVDNTAFTNSTNWKIGAGVEGAYGFPKAGTISASVKGEYGETSTATQSIETTNQIGVGGKMQGVDPQYQYRITPFFYWTKAGALVLDYVFTPGNTTWWNTGGGWNKPDLAFILPWKYQPCGEAQGKSQADISPEITFDNSTPRDGQAVMVTARVHNYSTAKAFGVHVKFYLGDPDQGGVPLSCTPSPFDIEARKYTDFKCSITASGHGEQRIYARVDPNNVITERVEDNNKAYGVLSVASSSASGADPGMLSQKEGRLLVLDTAGEKTTTVFIPYTTLPQLAVTSFTLEPDGRTDRSFTITAIRVNENGAWAKTDQVFGVLGNPNHTIPPAWVSLQYADSDLHSGVDDEAELRLYYWNEGAKRWEDEAAACGPVIRDPVNNVLMAPICHTGTFAMSSSAALPVDYPVYLPLVKK